MGRGVVSGDRLPSLLAVSQAALATVERQRAAGDLTDKQAAAIGREVWVAALARGAASRRNRGGKSAVFRPPPPKF